MKAINSVFNKSNRIAYGLVILSLGIFAIALRPHDNADTKAGWKKYAGSPVLGGKFGTIFDITVLKEPDGYKMWNSWRPKKSIALSESKDGFHWTDPVPVLQPNPGNAWEEDLNRPGVIKKDNMYHMWYTGQA